MDTDDPLDQAHAARKGRPHKLADENLRQLIYRVLRAGGSRTDAAAKARVSVNTIRNEARRDRIFRRGLRDAETDGKLSLLVTIREAAKKEWRAAAWMLERKYWQEFARRGPDQVTPQQVTAVTMQIVECLLEIVPAEHHARLNERMQQLVLRFEKESQDQLPKAWRRQSDSNARRSA